MSPYRPYRVGVLYRSTAGKALFSINYPGAFLYLVLLPINAALLQILSQCLADRNDNQTDFMTPPNQYHYLHYYFYYCHYPIVRLPELSHARHF